MEGLKEDTHEVLKRYIDSIDNKSAAKRFKPLPSNEFKESEAHPDIRYFRSIKNKNHYEYHKKKAVVDAKAENSTNFSPFDRSRLLNRLRTYRSSNWYLPVLPPSASTLSELECACHGWECVESSPTSRWKNHLICTACCNEVYLMFNYTISSSSNVPHSLSGSDYDFVNEALMRKYSQLIISSGHNKNCPWVNLHTPKETVYYFTPYAMATNRILFDEYVVALKSIFVHLGSLLSSYRLERLEFPENIDSTIISKFVTSSKSLLVDKNADLSNGEDLSVDNIPISFFFIAASGWKLLVKSFNDERLELFKCDSCGGVASVPSILEPKSSQSNSLSVFSDSPELQHATAMLSSLNNKHKSWCCHTKPMLGDMNASIYLTMMLAKLESPTDLRNDDFFPDLLIQPSTVNEAENSSSRIADNMRILKNLRNFYLLK